MVGKNIRVQRTFRGAHLTRVLIIGGYGNFGSYISKRLAEENNLQIIIAGRTLSKAQAFAKEINAKAELIDIHHHLPAR